MTIFNRILQFIDFKGISKNKFSIETGLSNSYLTKMEDNSSIGSKIILKIVSIYPELNLNWLMTGSGEMILKPNNNTESKTGMNCSECAFKELADERKERIAELNATIALLKDKIEQLTRANRSDESKRRSA